MISDLLFNKEANILDKVELNGTANCFITLKDHKANFGSYKHVNSDHPPSILQQNPKSIEKRLSSLSSPKEIFEETENSTSQTVDTKKS